MRKKYLLSLLVLSSLTSYDGCSCLKQSPFNTGSIAQKHQGKIIAGTTGVLIAGIVILKLGEKTFPAQEARDSFDKMMGSLEIFKLYFEELKLPSAKKHSSTEFKKLRKQFDLLKQKVIKEQEDCHTRLKKVNAKSSPFLKALWTDYSSRIDFLAELLTLPLKNEVINSMSTLGIMVIYNISIPIKDISARLADKPRHNILTSDVMKYWNENITHKNITLKLFKQEFNTPNLEKKAKE